MRYFLGLLMTLAATNVLALHDPTRPPIEILRKMEKKNEAIVLSGITFSKYRKVAVINNKSYVVGETVAGYKLVRITEDRVFLQQGDTVTAFPLLKQEMKAKD